MPVTMAAPIEPCRLASRFDLMDRDLALAGGLEGIRDQVERNLPRHRDPERFQICGDLHRIVSRLRGGQPPHGDG